MKRILITLSLGLSLFANETPSSKTYEDYIKSGGKENHNLTELIKKDSYYKKAVDYLENPEFQAVKEVNFSDPEDKNAKPKIIKQQLPDYVNALKEFKKSVDAYNNPISAYSGLKIIKTVYGKGKELKYYNKFAKLLYSKEKNICTVYIDYGDVLSKGIYTKIDKQKALNIYTEGLNNQNCKGWYQNILSGRAVYLKRALDK